MGLDLQLFGASDLNAQAILGFVQLLWPLTDVPHPTLARRLKKVRQVLADPSLLPAFFTEG